MVNAEIECKTTHTASNYLCERNSEDAIIFFEYLNMCYPSIKFTMETEEKVNFNVLLTKQSTSDNQCSCITSVFS